MTTYWRGTSDDRRNTDHWKSLMELSSEAKNPADIDFEIARQTAQIISSSSGNFIWIWKRGVHFPFFDDFPENEAQWKPTTDSVRLDSVSREALVNTYDNGIKYNVDNFFKILVPEILKNPNNIIIYTSDHGQNLLESGQIVTHCGNSKNESNVPLFIIGGNDLKINPDYKASHINLFPTLLDLMEVPSEMRKYNYADSLLNLDAKSPERRFYWGMELTSGEKYPFD
jgi:glucan phosphoethanolaminetransferase (alkaline phosphatase superfamily)